MDYIVQFLLNKEKGKDDANLRLRVKWDNSKNIVNFNLGYRVEISKWSTKTQYCNINTTHGKKKIPASVINDKITEWKKYTKIIFKLYENPTEEQFRQEFNILRGKIKKAFKNKSLFDVFDEFILNEGRKNHWTENTEKKMISIKGHLKKFKKELDFKDINERWFLDYQYYLQESCELMNSTVEKNIKQVKWFFRWSVENGYIINYNFKNFKPRIKTANKKIIFLDGEEIKKLINTKIPLNKEYLERVRDVFLFLCFTGLRYSDVANLKMSNVKKNHIEITSIKDVDNLIIELNSHSKKILEKYKDLEEGVLPIISNQKMNDYLKELCEIAEINEIISITHYNGNERIDQDIPKYLLITTKAGRKSFICNALSLGISPQIVMKWTGHNDYQSMKPYIDIVDEMKARAMTLFDDLV